MPDYGSQVTKRWPVVVKGWLRLCELLRFAHAAKVLKCTY